MSFKGIRTAVEPRERIPLRRGLRGRDEPPETLPFALPGTFPRQSISRRPTCREEGRGRWHIAAEQRLPRTVSTDAKRTEKPPWSSCLGPSPGGPSLPERGQAFRARSRGVRAADGPGPYRFGTNRYHTGLCPVSRPVRP